MRRQQHLFPGTVYAGKIKTVKRQNKKKQEKIRKSPKGNRKICQNVDKKSTKFPVST